MSEFGAMQAASNDAGSWTLIEQTGEDEWAPLARGGKQNIVRLAARLNAAPLPMPPQAAQAREPGPVITRQEVEGWTQDEYLQARARLYYVPRDGGAGDYRDGSETGRPYTTPAAALMTGPPAEHQPRLQLLKLTAAARDVAATWNKKPATELDKEWPAMARLQHVLIELGQ